METKIINSKTIEQKDLDNIVKCIVEGGLVAFPTETVYGLGGDGLNPLAAEKIYKAKGRPSDNPLILHISNFDMLNKLVTTVSPTAKKLIDSFWPGPLTIILPKSENVPFTTTGGLSTVAIRMPNCTITRRIISESKTPLAGPSANISGRPSPTNAQMVYDDLNGKIEYIIDNGQSNLGLESTIVDCSGDVPIVLRPGTITLDILKDICPDIKLDKSLVYDHRLVKFQQEIKPKAPGMKYRHYAPSSPMILYEGDFSDILDSYLSVFDNIKKNNNCIELQYVHNLEPKIGFIISKELYDTLNKDYNFFKKNQVTDDCIYIYGEMNNYYKIAKNIYKSLAFFDDKNVDFIMTQGVKPEGLGFAIMNRLRKAANS